jgi:hypothetical protein
MLILTPLKSLILSQSNNFQRCYMLEKLTIVRRDRNLRWHDQSHEKDDDSVPHTSVCRSEIR